MSGGQATWHERRSAALAPEAATAVARLAPALSLPTASRRPSTPRLAERSAIIVVARRAVLYRGREAMLTTP